LLLFTWLCAVAVQIQVIEEVNRDGVPLNTAAGQKASTDINSGPVTSSFTAKVPPPSAGFAAPGFGLFGTATDTSAQTFGASTANAFPGPVNLFSPSASTFGQVPQQSSAGTGFGGFTSSPQPQAAFGFAQPAGGNTGQSHATDVATSCASLVYTPLDQLSVEDRAQYEAPKFTLGHVPVRPPPKELV